MGPLNVAELLHISNLKLYIGMVDKELLAVVPKTGSLKAPIERLLKAPSKRLRSALVLASFGSGKEVDGTVIAGCVAVELVHLASLVHDDIMDEADVRRGVPTVSSKEGLNQAILAGDYLFAKANEVASRISPEVAISIAKTIGQLCEGQALELADANNIDRTINSYIQAIRGKTGSLLAESCRIGSLISGHDSVQVNALAEFGEYFGVSFQIVDDILDFVSSPGLLGKPVGNDIVEGVYTLPVILALQGSHRKKMLSCLQNASSIRNSTTTLLIHEGYIRQADKAIKKYNQMAKDAISAFDNNGLQDFPQAYSDWASSQLVAEQYK